MALTCNINNRGRLARFLYGLSLTLLGLILIPFWAMPTATITSWAIAICVILAGLFAIFEAAVGWCAIRAMGFKTPM